MRYTVLSTDNNKEYLSLVPVSCHGWVALGYTPIVLYVDCCIEMLRDLCPPQTIFYEVGVVPGIRTSTVAQISRLFASAIPGLLNDDILITTDADMLVAEDIFNDDGDIISYGYDLTGRSEVPICYVKASVGKWKELMNIGRRTLDEEMAKQMPERAYLDKWEDYWCSDQQLLTAKCQLYGLDKITFIDRGSDNNNDGLPYGRWDRYNWKKPEDIIDVHLLRSPFADGNFEKTLDAFKTCFPGKDLSFIHETKRRLYTAPEYVLDFISKDMPQFMNVTGNWDNHRPLLAIALKSTHGLVVEYGSGDGSTTLLREYCNDPESGCTFKSYDNNKDWAEKTGSVYVENWDELETEPCAIAFVDHAPGEHRKVMVQKLKDIAQVIVIHDTEVGGAGDYGFESVWPLFKHRLHLNRSGGGAGASIVSNFIDVSEYSGFNLAGFKLE